MPSYRDLEARRAYRREWMRRKRAQSQAVNSTSVNSQPVNSSSVNPSVVNSTPVSSRLVNAPAVSAIDKARARKLQALATNTAETAAAREGFRVRFDELASRLGVSPQALSAAL